MQQKANMRTRKESPPRWGRPEGWSAKRLERRVSPEPAGEPLAGTQCLHVFLHCQIRHKTQPPQGPVHQHPDPIVSSAMTHLSGSAFQGCSRGQTDAHLGGGPVPPGAAQCSQADPVATAGLRRQLLGPLNRVLLLVLHLLRTTVRYTRTGAGLLTAAVHANELLLRVKASVKQEPNSGREAIAVPARSHLSVRPAATFPAGEAPDRGPTSRWSNPAASGDDNVIDGRATPGAFASRQITMRSISSSVTVVKPTNKRLSRRRDCSPCGPASRLARKGFLHGRPRQSPARAGTESG